MEETVVVSQAWDKHAGVAFIQWLAARVMGQYKSMVLQAHRGSTSHTDSNTTMYNVHSMLYPWHTDLMLGVQI